MGDMRAHFETIARENERLQREAAEAPPIEVKKEEVLLDTMTVSDKKKSKEKPLPKISVLNKCTLVDYVVALVDGSLQVRMYNIEKNEGSFQTAVAAFVADAIEVYNFISDKLPEAGGTPGSFLDLFDSVLTVMKCSVVGTPPPPSEVRGARHKINTANTLPSPWEIVMAMELHKAPARAMDVALKQAAVGLADEAADVQFNTMFDNLEAKLNIAFEDGDDAFATAGEPNNGHNFESYRQFFDLGQTSACEVKMVVKAWSASRTEDRLNDLCTVVQSMMLICRTAVYVAARGFEKELMMLTKLACAGEPLNMPTTDTTTTMTTTSLAAPSAPATLDDHHGDDLASSQTDIGGKESIIDKSALMRMGALRAELPEFKAKLQTHMQTIHERLADAQAIDNLLETRMSDKFRQEAEASGIDLDAISNEVAANQEIFDLVLIYLEDMCTIAPQTPLNIKAMKNEVIANEQYLEALTGFCSAHRRIAEDPQLIRLHTVQRSALPGLVQLPKFITEIFMKYGKALYPTTGVLVNCLLNFNIKINMCEYGVLENHGSVDSLLPMILAAPPASTMCESVPHCVVADAEESFAKTPQHIIFSNLEVVVSALDISHLHVPGLHLPNKDNNEAIPVERALTFLKVFMHLIDVFSMASTIHQRFVLPLVQNMALTEEMLVEHLPHIFGHLGHSLTKLDLLMSSKEVSDMECEGWMVPCSFALARSCRQMVALFRSRSQGALLEKWASLLQEMSTTTTAACPTLGACINDATMDEPLAISMVSGKLASVVAAHNKLHEQLEKLGAGAVAMLLAPRLQDHPKVKDSVAIALHSLNVAKSSVMVIRGLNLLQKTRNSRDGPSQMQAFLDSCHPDDRVLVPKPFWSCLDAFAKESLPPAASGATRTNEHDDTAASEDSRRPASMSSQTLVVKRPQAGSPGDAPPSANALRLKRRRQG